VARALVHRAVQAENGGRIGMDDAPSFFDLAWLRPVSRGDHCGLRGIERGLREEAAGDVIASFAIQGGEVIRAVEG